ncbi:MAG: ribonuclease III domain-containing protein, partial [Acidobacteriota bacterium]
MNASLRRRILEEAWVGDAVLSLYARRRILGEAGSVNSEKFERMTSNRFLAAFGEPSEVEAEIGGRYAEEGLEAAFSWIEQKLMPLFERQEEKRLR